LGQGLALAVNCVLSRAGQLASATPEARVARPGRLVRLLAANRTSARPVTGQAELQSLRVPGQMTKNARTNPGWIARDNAENRPLSAPQEGVEPSMGKTSWS
jgi:hypothetical protein